MLYQSYPSMRAHDKGSVRRSRKQIAERNYGKTSTSMRTMNPCRSDERRHRSSAIARVAFRPTFALFFWPRIYNEKF